MKRLKLRHTKQFVSLIEAHGKAKNLGRRERIKLGLYDTDAVLLPKHIEQCLGIGSKTGQVWNAYKRGDRAMPRKALERRVEIGVTQKLLPADVARAFLLDVSISTLGANLAAWPTSEPTDFGLEYFSPTYAMQLALVHAGAQLLTLARKLAEQDESTGGGKSGVRELLAPVAQYISTLPQGSSTVSRNVSATLMSQLRPTRSEQVGPTSTD